MEPELLKNENSYMDGIGQLKDLLSKGNLTGIKKMINSYEASSARCQKKIDDKILVIARLKRELKDAEENKDERTLTSQKEQSIYALIIKEAQFAIKNGCLESDKKALKKKSTPKKRKKTTKKKEGA